MKDSTFNFIMNAEIPEDMIDDVIPKPTDTSYTEDVDPALAASLVGKDAVTPGSRFKLVTDQYSSTLMRYDTTRDANDPEYMTEYVLETYEPGTKEVQADSVRDGFWDVYDEKRKFDVRYVVAAIFVLLGIVGVALLTFVLTL